LLLGPIAPLASWLSVIGNTAVNQYWPSRAGSGGARVPNNADHHRQYNQNGLREHGEISYLKMITPPSILRNKGATG
jgi:hypothetical protein